MDKIYYERNLPHWHPPGSTFFLTYRLAGSIPLKAIWELKRASELEISQAWKNHAGCELQQTIYEIHRRAFGRYDQWLDHATNGPFWLKEPYVAQLLKDSLHFLDGNQVKLWAYCIMSNHVHVLLKHHEPALPMYKIMQSHKGFTGFEGNKALKRSGPFWQRETYDHLVRDQGEFDRIVRYILNNPVKAKLVSHWQEWPNSYLYPDLMK